MGPRQERLKVHRRTLRLDHAAYTVLSPRPGGAASFTTSRRDGTWRIQADAEGAQLLARLCWAMAYQRHPRTVAVIDPTALAPDPAGVGTAAIVPAAIVIANRELGEFGPGAAAALGAQLPLEGPSAGTVVLQTRGLDLALADPAAFARRDDQAGATAGDPWQQWEAGAEDLVVMAAPSPLLRAWGVRWSGLSPQGSSSAV
jgi:hypothetical protein